MANADAIRGLLQFLIDVGIAERVVWRHDPSKARVAARTAGAGRSAASRSIDWGILESKGRPASEHVDGRRLRRSPRFAGRTTAGAWIVRIGNGRGRISTLFVEPGLKALIDMAWVRGLAAVLEALECDGEARPRIAEEATLAMVGRRAAALAHDLRNVLTLGCLELDRARARPQETDRIRAVLESARNLCETTLSDGPHPSRVQEFFVRDCLHRMARAAERIAGREGAVVVDCRQAGDLGVDKIALERILQNLLLNALQASPDGGEVRLEADARPEGGIEIRVVDRGRGMAPEDVPGLFSPGRSEGGSSGHGTTSLRECAERLGAELRVESATGQGTCVRVLIPGTTRPPAVILVDQDARGRSGIASGLRRRGWSVRTPHDPAATCSEAVRPGVLGIAVARGTPGQGWVALSERAHREGIPLVVYDSPRSEAAGCAASIEAAVARCPLTPAGRRS